MLGICFDFRNKNYGSKLQALATMKMIGQYSENFEIIRYNKRTLRFYIRSIPRFFNIVFLNDRYDQIQRKIEYRRHPKVKANIDIRNCEMDRFDQQFIPFESEVYPSYEMLKEQCADRYDRLITCSDQLWSPSALGSGFYNLMFAPREMPKVSWASSFGVSEIPWYQRRRTREYLNRIQHISMRENRGAEIVKELTGKEVPVLMDPVFVFDMAEWDALVERRNSEWDDYIFCYFLGDNQEHRRAARELAQKTGLKIVALRHLDRYIAEDENFGDYAPYDVGPDRFLNILRNAKYVCTDSFHGSAFSIIYEKQFVVFDRYSSKSKNSKNSRIDSLCVNLDLSERRYAPGVDIAELMLRRIDYVDVKRRLSVYQERTKEYLKNALS